MASTTLLDDDTGDRRGGPHLARNAAVAVAVVLVALIGLLATRTPGDQTRPEARILGKAVPEVRGTTIAGTAYDIDSHKGSWVVVNFFASWCTPCRVEQPELVKFAQAHAGSNVQVVSVAFQDKESDVRGFFATSGGTWPVLIGDTGSIALSFGVTAVPESYIVSPDGQVLAKYEGVTADALDQKIAEYQAAAQGPSTTVAAP